MSLEPLIPNRLDDENSALVVLDQTLLPNEVKYLSLRTNAEICHAIKTLQVRGAPAIGVAAGYGAYLAAKSAPNWRPPALRQSTCSGPSTVWTKRPCP